MVIAIPFLSSCIPQYKAIVTQEIDFAQDSNKQNVNIACADSLLFPKQKKYSFVPVKIENYSNAPFEISEQSISVFSNYEQVQLVEPQVYMKKLRKKYWGYAILAAYGVTILVVSGEDLTPPTSIIAMGMMGIAAFNIYKTVKHNGLQKEDMHLLDLNGESILPGEIKTGLLVLGRPNCTNISIRIE